MSKELAFTDDNDVVKYLDTTTAFNLALTANGVAFDLTNAKSILVKIANDDGYIMQEAIDLTTVTSPLGGTLSFPINQDIMSTLVPDDYDIEVWVTMNDGTQAIFPSDGTLGFSIEENLMSDTGEVIPTITLNDFQQQFDDLSSQMENAVHNVQKGDQGNPGNGIKSANNQYQLSDSPVTVPTGGWSDTILATTDKLPYLWTKIIFIYDDGTTKETNFVSSRGDTGSQGPMGPVGPQGKQGNGLVVRGKADKEENLPTAGNNQGDGYLVGTDLYIWIDGSWQNMGSITPDLADYVKVADMNNALNTKVNIADMRKPASDVAGLEDVNAKQDKIGYTPADDSKVVHSTVTPLNSTDMNTVLTAGFYQLISGTNGIPNTDAWTIYQVIPLNSLNGVQVAYGTNSVVLGMRSWNSGPGHINFTSWVQFADDSKVAHLSGANNFDTVPTVNNNPLLLASSLPSDLARTGQDTNFTRKLQKSGIDVATTADVSKAVNTATSNVVTTDKPANFTAGLQVNGKDVGTGGGDKLTTPWVVTNYQSTDTMGPHGCNEATGWRIYNDILYYYGYFYGATVSEAVIFNLYTAYPDFKKTFKTLGSSPELIYQTPAGFWAFNDWGNQMVGNEGNLLIGIKDTATPLSVNIVYPLDRL
ncbi:pyocin knob domain-containing protein [Lentilactobacillus parabuchneri]|uniref:pyocin knob domain-containing protein n=1 Tax=Lentilactobacillus parabuchneri TaxID=152331 RepID=UPI000A118CB5|nr:pyocin knob domain-containing protein [Lentilactobacillus parabuchneri]ORN31830.1 hypothetical protein FAM23280_01867 [Lentilactobacillus parabuchneri]ORN32422.1 hypothetical protein FAM23279_01867 [Lentilactobacillus parabuchneri]ORN36341.1 hypothetical protein FAM23281_01870 [Lentilactobacillus parabuchneri]